MRNGVRGPVLAVCDRHPPATETGDEENVALLTVPTFLQMMGAAAAMLTVLAVIWLVYRIRQSRIPVWERKKPRKRRRRR